MKSLAAAPIPAASRVPKVSLGEPLRFRVETTMRKAPKAHAAALTETAGHDVSVGGAVRELLGRALATTPSNGYLEGFREGFVAGFADAKRRTSARADDHDRSPIGPQPSRDNDDYQGDGEGEL